MQLRSFWPVMLAATLSCSNESEECEGEECECGAGFETTAAGCVDINECSTTTCGDPLMECVNTPGSFLCRCPEGYFREGQSCVDQNECETDNGGCGFGTCTNEVGSHQCACWPGAKLVGGECVSDAELATIRMDVACEQPLGFVCVSPEQARVEVAMTGSSDVEYVVELLVRGIAELNTYANGTGSGEFIMGGDATGTATVYALDIIDPTTTTTVASYRLNNGAESTHIVALTYTATVAIHGGSLVKLTMTSPDRRMNRNIGADGGPEALDGIPAPTPEAVEGQIIQIDARSIVPKH